MAASSGVDRHVGFGPRLPLALFGVLAVLAAGCGGSSGPPGSASNRTGSASAPAAERTRLLTQFRTREETQGFSPEIAACLAHHASHLPLDFLRNGTPSAHWYLVVLTTSRCGPPAVRTFIVRGLERQFRSKPQAYPAGYRTCIVARVLRLPAGQVSMFVVDAIQGRSGLNQALARIAGTCQAGAR